MGATLVDAFLRGHRGAWIGLLALVLIAAVAVVVQRAPKASPGRILLTSALVSVLSVAGVLAGTALAVPRIVWRRVTVPPFVAASGPTWRSARAPSTALLVGGAPEVGVAGIDEAGRVRLFGLFSGAPLEGYPDAPAGPPASGRVRICHVAKEECRTWPAEWPEPAAASSGSDFIWTRDLLSKALAYDVESGLLLHHIEGLRSAESAVAMAGKAAAPPPQAVATTAGAWALEQSGKLTNEPSRDGPTSLFVVRRIARDRLDAVRIVSVPAGEAFTFSVERATVSLSAAPAVFAWFARPVLLALVVWFPFVSLALQGAPAWWASRRRKRMAAGEPLSEMPEDAATFQRAARDAMAKKLHGPAIFAVGLALAAPAAVAVVGMISGR
jgi:hypothetical protein